MGRLKIKKREVKDRKRAMNVRSCIYANARKECEGRWVRKEH